MIRLIYTIDFLYSSKSFAIVCCLGSIIAAPVVCVPPSMEVVMTKIVVDGGWCVNCRCLVGSLMVPSSSSQWKRVVRLYRMSWYKRWHCVTFLLKQVRISLQLSRSHCFSTAWDRLWNHLHLSNCCHLERCNCHWILMQSLFGIFS